MNRCPNCGSKDRRSGEYIRAWNDLCKQAAGEIGDYCMTCRFIEFRTPDFEEWLESQPRWIVRRKGDKWRNAAEQSAHSDAGKSADLQADSNADNKSTSHAVA